MKHYALPIAAEDIAALEVLRAGVSNIGVIGRAKGLEGVFGCVLEATSGEVVELRARQQDLEYKFEVFPISAKTGASLAQAEELQPFLLAPPVQLLLLQTEDWLDPEVPCEGAIGQNPIMQCQGRPGQAPSSAIAACQYVGGVELRGNNGSALTVATLPFPYAIHVSAIQGTGTLAQEAYIGVAASVA
jgi:hypothetical protein